MQVHIFISEKAHAGDRLISALQSIMSSNPVIQYHRADTFGRMVSPTSKEPIIAVIMVGENEELTLLSESKGIWDRFKTIIVLQNDDQETINLCLSLRPIFITYMDSDFSEVTNILDHIKNRSEIDFQNPVSVNEK
jgi:hypothetical protein